MTLHLQRTREVKENRSKQRKRKLLKTALFFYELLKICGERPVYDQELELLF